MPNMFSLIDSRKNFSQGGAAIPGDTRVRAPLGDEVPI